MAIRFQDVKSGGAGTETLPDSDCGDIVLTGRVDRAKRCMWNGKSAKGLRYLQSVQACRILGRTGEAQARSPGAALFETWYCI
jgi:hypothetical protein